MDSTFDKILFLTAKVHQKKSALIVGGSIVKLKLKIVAQ